MIHQGIHPGLGMAEYHAWSLDRAKLIDGPISCSMLKSFAPNPYEWLHTPERKQSDAMRTGTLFDAAVTDPKELETLIPLPVRDFDKIAIAPYEHFKTKEAQEWKRVQIAAGMEVMKEEEYAKAKTGHQEAIDKIMEQRDKLGKAAEAVRSHHIAGAIMEGAQFQVGVIGEIGGIPAKCLIDILPDADGDYGETIVDYKTTSTGLDDESIRKAIGTYKYHWQGAFYRSLFNKVSTDRNIDDFVLIFQSPATLEVRVVHLADDAMALGTRAIKQAILEFTRCSHKGIGSRYAKTCEQLDLMPYHAMGEDEELSMKEHREGGAE